MTYFEHTLSGKLTKIIYTRLCEVPSRITFKILMTFMYKNVGMGFLSDTYNCRLRMRRECRERFPPPPISKETASKRDARAVMHVGIAYPRWRGKRPRHSRRMRTRNVAYLARGPLKRNENFGIFRPWYICTSKRFVPDNLFQMVTEIFAIVAH